MFRYRLIAFLLLFLPMWASAQVADSDYREAEEAYGLGRFEDVDSLLKGKIPYMKSEYRVGAYRLLVLSSLYQDKHVEAENYARSLLTVDPYYTPHGDVPRFVDLIESLKTGKAATITTASQQAETIEEAPVPVTLITEDMIKMSGAKTLMDLLVDYVPGVFRMEGIEPNLSMRGMYGYSQEAVLVMLNGVRLNSYATSSVALDYRISLANVKQIEVLRGPAASLYGNAALSAVVNVITKGGSDVDGLDVTVGAGNTNAYKADAVFGKRFLDIDLLVWGSLYQSDGYRRHIAADDMVDNYGTYLTDGSLLIDGYNQRPAYDVGMTLKWKGLSFQLSQQYSKRTFSYCDMFAPSPYQYERYGEINGVKPGRGTTATNVNLRYAQKVGHWIVDGGVGFNHESVMAYNIMGDSLPGTFNFAIILKPDEYVKDLNFTEGTFLVQDWKNSTVSADVKAGYDYKNILGGKGSILLGVQYNNFNQYYNDVMMGDKYTRVAVFTANDHVTIFKNNREQEFSLFGQLKHYVTPRLILNGGLRYDYKHRYTDKNFNVISPRVALAWNPTQTQSYKLSYSKAFVDVPYFYRVSQVVYPGNENLKSEYINDFQASGTFKFPKVRLTYETNVFFNNIKDAMTIFGDKGAVNVEKINVVGWENILKYQVSGFNISLNTYWQHVLTAGFPAGNDGHTIYNVPTFATHLTASKSLAKNLWITLKPSFWTKQSTPCLITRAVRKDVNLYGMPGTQPACFLLDASLHYDWNRFSFSCAGYNLLNHKYRLGGDRVPVLQQGFTILGTVSYHIGKKN